MPVIDLGKVVGNPGASMRFRGEWLSGSEYFNNESYIDTVTHNGSLWICKTTNTGQEPIEGDYWGMGAYGTVTGFDATISLPATGWSGSSAPYAQTVSVSGMTATKAVVYALVSNSETPTDTENSNYGKITGISQNTDSVTFYAAEKPTADIVIRAFSGADTEQAADLSIIAAPFDAGSSYLADDYTLYEGQMYKFTENKDPGAWDTSKVTLTTVSDELKSQAAELASQAEDIADLNSRAAIKASDFWVTQGIEVRTAYITKIGNAITVYAIIKFESDVPVPDGVKIATINPGYRVPQNYKVSPIRSTTEASSPYSEIGTLWQYADGSLYAYGNIKTDTVAYLQFDYLCG